MKNQENIDELKYAITSQPDFTQLRVELPLGKTLKVEAAAMAEMSPNLHLKTRIRGAFNRILTGENLFINEFTAQVGDSHIRISPGVFGNIEHVKVSSENCYVIASSAFLASASTVEVSSQWQGLVKGFFGRAGLFLMRATGHGDLWFHSLGSLHKIEINGQYTVDNGHVVAFSDGLNYKLGKLGGYKSLLFSGEGLVCRFEGKGTLWIQSQNVGDFAAWIRPFRRVRQKTKNNS